MSRSFGGAAGSDCAPSTMLSTGCPHRSRTRGQGFAERPEFVEKRVDRLVRLPVSLVVPEGASQTGDTEIASRIAGQQGRFGRFVARDAEAFGPPVWDPLGET